MQLVKFESFFNRITIDIKLDEDMINPSQWRRGIITNLVVNLKEEIKMAIKKFLKKFIQEEEGATAVEYAVMIVLIIVVCLAAVTLLGEKVNNAFNAVATNMP
jgi:pilus assembly protein Flp/PilA